MTKTGPSGSYLIADDAFVAIVGGKITLQGIYTGDIVIPADGAQTGQLVFFFHLVSPLKKLIQKAHTEIKFPEVERVFTMALPDTLPSLHQIERDKTSWSIMFPFPVIGPILHSGKIEVLVTYKGGEFQLPPTWIITAEENQRRTAKRTTLPAG